MSPRPPLIPRVLGGLLLRGEEREVIAGDLEEEYRHLVSRREGAGAASRWYWRQSMRALGGRSFERTRQILGRMVAPGQGNQGGPFRGKGKRGGGIMHDTWQDLRFGL